MKKIFIFSIIVFTAINSKAQVRVGQAAPEISLPGTNDSLVNLSAFKGKVVMVDFWASWCDPCRRANPNVVKLYDKYKDKGFEVLAVSIDLRKSDWLRAIKKDKLNYTQVNANKGWDSRVTYVYGIDAIPAAVLIDRKGVIAAIDPQKEELEGKIIKLLQ